jgi:hypothetical protein
LLFFSFVCFVFVCVVLPEARFARITGHISPSTLRPKLRMYG